METKKVVVQVPKSVSARDVKRIVKKLFSFNANKYYGKSKEFSLVKE